MLPVAEFKEARKNERQAERVLELQAGHRAVARDHTAIERLNPPWEGATVICANKAVQLLCAQVIGDLDAGRPIDRARLDWFIEHRTLDWRRANWGPYLNHAEAQQALDDIARAQALVIDAVSGG